METTDTAKPYTTLKTIKERVGRVLAGNPRTRNDDRLLLSEYEARYGRSSPESVTRARRYYQNNLGVLLPTDPKVIVQRRVKREIYARYYANDSTLLKRIDDERFSIR